MNDDDVDSNSITTRLPIIIGLVAFDDNGDGEALLLVCIALWLQTYATERVIRYIITVSYTHLTLPTTAIV